MAQLLQGDPLRPWESTMGQPTGPSGKNPSKTRVLSKAFTMGKLAINLWGIGKTRNSGFLKSISTTVLPPKKNSRGWRSWSHQFQPPFWALEANSFSGVSFGTLVKTISIEEVFGGNPGTVGWYPHGRGCSILLVKIRANPCLCVCVCVCQHLKGTWMGNANFIPASSSSWNNH